MSTKEGNYALVKNQAMTLLSRLALAGAQVRYSID